MSGTQPPSPPPRLIAQRRLNTKRVLIAGGAVVVLLVVIPLGWALWQSELSTRWTAGTDTDAVHSANPAGALAGNVRKAAFGPTITPPGKTPEKIQDTPPPGPPPVQPLGGGASGGQAPVDPVEEARRKAWATYYEQIAQLQQARFSEALAARTAGTSLTQGGGGDSAGTGTSGQLTGISGGASAQAGAVAGDGAAAAQAGVGMGAGMGNDGYAVPAIQGIAANRAFLNGGADLSGASDELHATLVGPKPDTAMQGTAIPAVTIEGVDSDAPGLVRAMVTAPVFDTATGNDLLIPQFSTLVMYYDNRMVGGQTRLPIMVHRIIFPDTSSKDLGDMPAADQAGYAGFHDQVDTHWLSKFGNALILGIGGAAVQLSQGSSQSAYGYNSQQIAAAQLGQQFAQLGQEYARAGLSIPNTLRIRPGYRFIVKLTKDVPLPPYHDQRLPGAMPVSLGAVIQ